MHKELLKGSPGSYMISDIQDNKSIIAETSCSNVIELWNILNVWLFLLL